MKKYGWSKKKYGVSHGGGDTGTRVFRVYVRTVIAALELRKKCINV